MSATATNPANPPGSHDIDALTGVWQRMASACIGVGIAAILLTLATMVAWITLAPLSGSIVAMGAIKVDTNRKTALM